MLAKISVNFASPVYEILDAGNSLQKQSYRQKLFGSRTMGPHQHGAGIAWSSAGQVQVSKVGAEDMWSAGFEAEIKSVKSQNIIAHVREASTGLKIDETCSHPFTAEFQGETLAFCHNGGIISYFDEAKIRGITDTQIYLEQILQNLSGLDLKSMMECLRRISADWRYSSATALLMSSQKLFVWRLINPQSPAVNHTAEIYTLFYRQSEDAITIASEPLDESAEWQAIENRQIYSFSIDKQSIRKEQAFI